MPPLPNYPHKFSATLSKNNFLLGGQYYPSKDKFRQKRRRFLGKRQHTLYLALKQQWLATPPHKRFALVSVLVVLVTVMTLVVIQLTQQYHPSPLQISWSKQKQQLQPPRLHETTLTLPQLSQEQAEIVLLQRQRSNAERLKLFEQVAPEWFHRNEMQQPEQQQKDFHNDDAPPADEAREETDGEPDPEIIPPATVHKEEAITTTDKEDLLSPTASPLPPHPPVEAPTATPLRTLQTMESNQTYPNNCPANLTATHMDTTLVVQASLDRIWVLDETCRRWTGPIVAVVVLKNNETEEVSELAGWRDKCPQLELVLYHFSGAPDQYPVNHARNIGLDSVSTSHILVVDVDFVPSMHLNHKIRATLEQQMGVSEEAHLQDNNSNKQALVVPAFERVLETPCRSEDDCMRHLRHNSSFIPGTFEALQGCVLAEDCIVFQSDVNWEGHHSTRSAEWLARQWYEDDKPAVTEQTEQEKTTHKKMSLQQVRTLKCFDSFRYEPYVVIRWCPSQQAEPKPVAPYYDERFHGYGKNKIEHISHLRFL